VTYKNSTDLEDAIKERIKRLLNSNTIDITPAITPNTLDDELGVAVYKPTEPIDEVVAGEIEEIEEIKDIIEEPKPDAS
jgi:hypothetical protein